MANIPVEKRDAGVPWWAWLLGLLALLLIGSLLMRGCDDSDDAASDVTVVDDGVSTAGDFDEDLAASDTIDGTSGTAVAPGTAGASGAALTSLDDLNRSFNDAGAGSLEGRVVNLPDVPVASVVGDSTFYVGTGADRVLVVLQDLGEQQPGAGGSDGRYNVDAGDVVTVRGRVARYVDGLRGLGGLGTDDRTEVQRRRYVIVTDPGGLSGADATR